LRRRLYEKSKLQKLVSQYKGITNKCKKKNVDVVKLSEN